MAWGYSDWITQTDLPTRLARLRRHIQEVTDKIGREHTAGDQATSSRELRAYLEVLTKREAELMAQPGATGENEGPAVSRFVFD